eukprot:PhM_4_TR11309/c0_g1_i1/m.46940
MFSQLRQYGKLWCTLTALRDVTLMSAVLSADYFVTRYSIVSDGNKGWYVTRRLPEHYDASKLRFSYVLVTVPETATLCPYWVAAVGGDYLEEYHRVPMNCVVLKKEAPAVYPPPAQVDQKSGDDDDDNFAPAVDELCSQNGVFASHIYGEVVMSTKSLPPFRPPPGYHPTEDATEATTSMS